MQITMGLMSRSVKEQKIIGLDPRTHLVTPIDVVPVVGGIIKMRQGAKLFQKGSQIRKAENLSLFTHIFRYDKVREQVLIGRSMKKSGLFSISQGLVLVGIDASVKMHSRSIINKESRGRGQSLTRGPTTPRQPQTKRSNASAGKRTFPPRLSKGGNVNGRARRQTSYCKLHGKYDFCEYYKK